MSVCTTKIRSTFVSRAASNSRISKSPYASLSSAASPALFQSQQSAPNNTRPTPTQQHQVRHRSNRSRRGLYDNRDIRAGNNVPFSLKKTKRTFKPNVFKKRLYSEVLDEMIPFHVTTGALRNIDKHGGLDQYLMRSDAIESGNNEGWKAKQRILQKIEHCENKGVSVLREIVFQKLEPEESKSANTNTAEKASS